MANSPARSIVDVGSVIADTYKIEALIGRGGMGAVFLASHARLPGKQVAIKLLHAEIVDPDVLARFRREAEIASRLGHPNIVAVHDFNVTPDGTPYLVLELLQGETLAQRLRNGPLPLEQTMSIMRQVGSALAAAHREGIVHRDLKPHNIFLVPTEIDGRIVEIAKVLDFGISKIRGSQTVKTQETALLGTPQYMAPEQATGQHATVDERTDVFALGAIVHEMLTGEPAFNGASIPEVVFKVVYEQPAPLPDTTPPHIAAAVQRAMAKPAAERFPTVSTFIEALTGQPLTQARPVLAAPDLGFANGSQKLSNPAALANTMDSGDYRTPPAQALEPGPRVEGNAATIQSLSSRDEPAPSSARSALPRAPTPPTVSSPRARAGSADPRTGAADPARASELGLAHTQATPPEVPALPPPAPPRPAPPAGKRIWPLVAVGAAAIAATAAVMFFVMGDDQRAEKAKQRPDKRERIEAPAERRADLPPDRPADTRGDAPRDTRVAAPGDKRGDPPARPTDTRATGSSTETDKRTTTDTRASAPGDKRTATATDTKPDKPARPGRTDDDPSLAELRDVLAEAETAYRRGDQATALRLTSRIINQGGASRVAAEAHVLRGIMLCNDLTVANGELRQIRGYPMLVRKLRAGCPNL